MLKLQKYLSDISWWWIIFAKCFWKELSVISCQGYCQRFSPLQTSDMLQVGFEPAKKVNLCFVKWSCAVVITSTSQHHIQSQIELHNQIKYLLKTFMLYFLYQSTIMIKWKIKTVSASKQIFSISFIYIYIYIYI